MVGVTARRSVEREGVACEALEGGSAFATWEAARSVDPARGCAEEVSTYGSGRGADEVTRGREPVEAVDVSGGIESIVDED